MRSALFATICDAPRVIDPVVAGQLMAEARSVLNGHLQTRAKPDGVAVDLTRQDGTVSWPDYAHGPDELLAVLAAEQRYLVEQLGRGSVAAATYLDIARERLRRAQQAEES